jgi:AcrR family transcriptional regulator
MSKRRSDAQQTRKQLIEAGRKAFAKKGLKGTVLRDDVLSPAGVSTGSFYHQFENNPDLLLSILKDNANSYRANVLEAMKPREGGTLEDIVRSAYMQTFDNADENGDIFQIASRQRGSTDTRIALYLEEDRKLWQLGLAKIYEKLFPNSSPKKIC